MSKEDGWDTCPRCGGEVYNEEQTGDVLCEECQDDQDARDHWHKEFLDDLAEDWPDY